MDRLDFIYAAGPSETILSSVVGEVQAVVSLKTRKETAGFRAALDGSPVKSVYPRFPRITEECCRCSASGLAWGRLVHISYGDPVFVPRPRSSPQQTA